MKEGLLAAWLLYMCDAVDEGAVFTEVGKEENIPR